MKKLISRRGMIFLALFTFLALAGMEINFSAIVGADSQFFTLFQFFGPIAGGFLGLWGTAAVLGAQVINFVFVGKEVTAINLLRLLPMMFAAIYFARNKGIAGNAVVVIPLLAMLAFWMHPTGAQAWYYALYWLIPVFSAIVLSIPESICQMFSNGIKQLLPLFLVNIITRAWDVSTLYMRGLGATFTAHSVGSVLWLYTVPMAAGAWIALIPVVAFERGLFALGIAVSYLLFTNVLGALDKMLDINLNEFLNIEKRYLIRA